MTKRVHALITAMLTLGLLTGCGSDAPNVSGAERATIKAYAASVKDVSFKGGQLLQEAVKPRITDLRDGTITPEEFADDAAAWIRIYTDLRAKLNELERVPRLDDPAARYDAAFARYLEAFRAFADASKEATQDARNQAITDAVPIAEDADKLFDAARESLARVMRVAGLNPATL